jgi:hypothetical protein
MRRWIWQREAVEPAFAVFRSSRACHLQILASSGSLFPQKLVEEEKTNIISHLQFLHHKSLRILMLIPFKPLPNQMFQRMDRS